MGDIYTDPPYPNGQDTDNTLLFKIARMLFGGAGGGSAQIALAPSTSTTAATPTQGVKAVASAGTPEPLADEPTLVESVEIHARKSTTAANTGAIYVGFSATPGQNYRVLLAGETFSISAPAGKKIDLAGIYIDAATNADAVTWSAVN